jgi:hypothetical protein
MKPSAGSVRAAWTFAAGSLFGALALFALLSSFGNAGAKAEASRPKSPAAQHVARVVGSPKASAAATRPPAVSIERHTAGSARQPAEDNQTTLDLQLD